MEWWYYILIWIISFWVPIFTGFRSEDHYKKDAGIPGTTLNSKLIALSVYLLL